MRVALTPAAQAEQDAIFEYLALRSPSGASRVIAAMERTFALISDHPEIGEATRQPSVRALFLGRYPYRVFYRAGRGTIQIVHIRHAARLPWVA